jgi:hypothetical protein
VGTVTKASDIITAWELFAADCQVTSKWPAVMSAWLSLLQTEFGVNVVRTRTRQGYVYRNITVDAALGLPPCQLQNTSAPELIHSDPLVNHVEVRGLTLVEPASGAPRALPEFIEDPSVIEDLPEDLLSEVSQGLVANWQKISHLAPEIQMSKAALVDLELINKMSESDRQKIVPADLMLGLVQPVEYSIWTNFKATQDRLKTFVHLVHLLSPSKPYSLNQPYEDMGYCFNFVTFIRVLPVVVWPDAWTNVESERTHDMPLWREALAKFKKDFPDHSWSTSKRKYQGCGFPRGYKRHVGYGRIFSLIGAGLVGQKKEIKDTFLQTASNRYHLHFYKIDFVSCHTAIARSLLALCNKKHTALDEALAGSLWATSIDFLATECPAFAQVVQENQKSLLKRLFYKSLNGGAKTTLEGTLKSSPSTSHLSTPENLLVIQQGVNLLPFMSELETFNKLCMRKGKSFGSFLLSSPGNTDQSYLAASRVLSSIESALTSMLTYECCKLSLVPVSFEHDGVIVASDSLIDTSQLREDLEEIINSSFSNILPDSHFSLSVDAIHPEGI